MTLLLRGAQALIATVVVVGGGPAHADEVFERDVVNVAAPPGVDISRVTVDNRLGDVTVRGHDRDGITVHAFKRARDSGTLDRLVVSLVPDPGGPVTIHTSLLAGAESRPIPAGSIEVDLVVHVPRSAQVRAQVWNGAVRVESVDNGARLGANEGTIHVHQVSGPVVTHIAHGRQELAEIFGEVDAVGVEGDLDLETVRGDRLAASVHRGRVSGRAIHVKELEVRTIRGSIRLEGVLVAGGRYRVQSLRGNIELRFSDGTSARVVARARRGEARLPERFRPRPADGGGIVGLYGTDRSPADVQLSTAVGHITVAQF